jgi:hypothetical protein
MQPQKHARASRFYHSRFKKHTRARCFFNYEIALAVPTQAWMLSGANKSMALRCKQNNGSRKKIAQGVSSEGRELNLCFGIVFRTLKRVPRENKPCMEDPRHIWIGIWRTKQSDGNEAQQGEPCKTGLAEEEL